jgi:hypothetical protein
MNSSVFHQNVRGAVDFAEKKTADKTTCPECSAKLALLGLSFRNRRIALLCRFCDFQTFVGAAAGLDVRAKEKPMRRSSKSKKRLKKRAA